MKNWVDEITDDVSLTAELFMAGQRVPAGVYKQLESRREFRLDSEDVLPASCDGRVAIYMRRPQRWADLSWAKKEM